MSITALPPHLRENNSMAAGRGVDWDNWIQRHIPQGWFAFGPNAESRIDWITLFCLPYKFGWNSKEKRPEFLKWFRVVFPIPVLAKWRKHPLLIIGYGITRWESTNAKSMIFVSPYAECWQSSLFGRRTQLPSTEMNPGHIEYKNPLLLENLNGYSPSTIQYWSKFSLGVLWPFHFIFAYRWGKKDPTTGRHKHTFFFRFGFRHDALDDYYDGPSFFLGGSFN